MKKFSAILIFTLVFLMFSGLSINTFALDSDFQVVGGTLVKYTGTDQIVTIPTTLGITKIGVCSFRNNTTMKYVIIPDTVTEIEPCAFEYCSSLLGVAIPSSVTTIGYYAFASCYNLKAILLPNSVTSMGEYMFRWSNYVTMYVQMQSFAQMYAMEMNIPFSTEEVNVSPPVITIGNYVKTWTNQDVPVPATVVNGVLNTASHKFILNGSFTFTASNLFGISASKSVKITNIDKIPPVIKGKNTSAFSVKITVTDAHLLKKIIKKNGKVIAWPSGNLLQSAGTYQITAFDLAGNQTSYRVILSGFKK